LRGGDADFDYREVDENEEFDEVEKREKEARWFDEEEPEWDGEESGGTSGETGVQDF
jgi:Coiled-coil domain containing protein 97-like, C-terminal